MDPEELLTWSKERGVIRTDQGSGVLFKTVRDQGRGRDDTLVSGVETVDNPTRLSRLGSTRPVVRDNYYIIIIRANIMYHINPDQVVFCSGPLFV